jgi:hypothetical protein
MDEGHPHQEEKYYRHSCQPRPDDSSISKYVFWTLENGSKANTGSDVSIGSAAGYVEYEPVVKYDLSQHAIWSDCNYEDGDLRTREAISTLTVITTNVC